MATYTSPTKLVSKLPSPFSVQIPQEFLWSIWLRFSERIEVILFCLNGVQHKARSGSVSSQCGRGWLLCLSGQTWWKSSNGDLESLRRSALPFWVCKAAAAVAVTAARRRNPDAAAAVCNWFFSIRKSRHLQCVLPLSTLATPTRKIDASSQGRNFAAQHTCFLTVRKVPPTWLIASAQEFFSCRKKKFLVPRKKFLRQEFFVEKFSFCGESRICIKNAVGVKNATAALFCIKKGCSSKNCSAFARKYVVNILGCVVRARDSKAVS